MHYRLDHYRDLDIDNDDLYGFLTAQEIMELLYVSKSTLYRLLRSGELKGFRAGKQWRVSKEEFLRFCGKA